MTIRRCTPSEPEPVWPTNCAEAAALVFVLRRRGLPLLPGISVDDWASSILRWSTGRTVRCVGLDEAA